MRNLIIFFLLYTISFGGKLIAQKGDPYIDPLAGIVTEMEQSPEEWYIRNMDGPKLNDETVKKMAKLATKTKKKLELNDVEMQLKSLGQMNYAGLPPKAQRRYNKLVRHESRTLYGFRTKVNRYLKKNYMLTQKKSSTNIQNKDNKDIPMIPDGRKRARLKTKEMKKLEKNGERWNKNKHPHPWYKRIFKKK